MFRRAFEYDLADASGFRLIVYSLRLIYGVCLAKWWLTAKGIKSVEEEAGSYCAVFGRYYEDFTLGLLRLIEWAREQLRRWQLP